MGGAVASLPGFNPEQRRRWRIVNYLNELEEPKRAKAVGACGRSAAWMQCSYEGRDLFKVMRCGRQECPDCGVAGSEAHNRRIARVMGHLGPARAGAKFVFTLPLYMRDLVNSRKAVGKLQRAAWTVVSRVFGVPEFGAISALHYFGDRKRNWLTWHPHVEVLVPGDWKRVPKAKLDELREEWGKTLERTFGRKLERYKTGPKVGRRIVSAFYKPRRKLAEWNHAVRYALRPTVGTDRFFDLVIYKPELAQLVLDVTRRVDNVRYWGALASRHYQATLEKLNAMAADVDPPWWLRVDEEEHWTGCPCCGEPVVFVGTILAADLQAMRDARAGPRGWIVDVKREPPPAVWDTPFLTVLSPPPNNPLEAAQLVASIGEPVEQLEQLRMWRQW